LRYAGFAGIRFFSNFFWKFRILPVKYPGRIRTGSHAKPATNASVAVDENQPILSLECGIHGTNFYTGWIITVHAGRGLPIRSGIFRILHRINFDPVLAGVEFMGMIAGGLAGFYIFAPGQIYNHNKFLSLDSNSFFAIYWRKMRNGFKKSFVHFDNLSFRREKFYHFPGWLHQLFQIVVIMFMA
jgi:hypothetical protein